MKSLSKIYIAILFAGASGLGAADFSVAPTGADTNPGNAEKPFATLARAQQAARTVAGTEPVTVHVRAGTYYLSETLIFTAGDSGSEKAPVSYQAVPAETVVLSGGRRLELTWAT